MYVWSQIEAVFLDRIKHKCLGFSLLLQINIYAHAVVTELLTLIESLMSPVGFPDDETSACLWIEIRKASTPISPILLPAMRKKVAKDYFLKAAFTQIPVRMIFSNILLLAPRSPGCVFKNKLWESWLVLSSPDPTVRVRALAWASPPPLGV